MSGLSDFIASPQIPPAPTSADTTTSNPVWMQQYIYNLANAASSLAMSPYPSNVPSLDLQPSDATQQSWGMALNNVGSWKPDLNQANAFTTASGQPTSTNSINTYATNYGQEVPTLASGITGALNQSIQSEIPSYMSPYTQQVVGGIESAMNTNLEQNVLPTVYDRYVQSGQSGSPQEMQAVNNAIYQNQQAVGQAVAPALEQGYNTSLSAAQNAGNTGLQAGITGTQGAATTALASQQLQQSAGAQSGQLGALTSEMGAMDTGQVAAAGQSQDTLTQNNQTANYNAFWNQENYPYLQLGFESNIVRGQQVPQTTQQAALQYNSNAGYSASPLASFAQGVLGSAATTGGSSGSKSGSALGGGAKGGSVAKFASVGSSIASSAGWGKNPVWVKDAAKATGGKVKRARKSKLGALNQLAEAA